VVVGALAASGDSSEEDFLAAVAVGIEVACRVQSAFGTRPGLFDVDAVALRLGTVAAVARLLGLDQSAVVLALGIAGGQSSGLALLRGTWAGALVLGRATADAVEACYLARDGYDASLEIIEGTGGAPDVMFPGASTTSITADLGSRWDSSTLVPAITALHEGD
jgi:2-methylcitrate dehydratase PrpD